MDQETPQKPEIKPEVNQNVKKRGWLANLLSFLGFGGSAGAGTGGITAVSGAGSGLFGGLLGGGVMATKAGMVALALAGSTVAGGIGFVGYKMFVNPNASGKAGASGRDQFNSLFASRPKDASPAQSSGSSASSKDGNSSSLEMMAKANQGPMAEGETKPEEAAAADTESKTSDAAADQAQANPTAALNNANAPAAGQAASLHSSGLKSDKKFGQLSSGLAGGSSGASFSTAMKGVPSASNPLLAGGKVDPASAMRGQGRSLQSGRRDQFKRESGTGRQLVNLNRMQKRGVGNAGTLTFDGGPGGTTIDGAEASGVSGTPSGQSGVPDRSLNPTPFSQKDVNEPATPFSKDVTPWKDTIKQVQMLTMGAALLLVAASLILTYFYEDWMATYGSLIKLHYIEAFNRDAALCTKTLTSCTDGVFATSVKASDAAAVNSCYGSSTASVGIAAKINLASGTMFTAQETALAAHSKLTAGGKAALMTEKEAKAAIAAKNQATVKSGATVQGGTAMALITGAMGEETGATSKTAATTATLATDHAAGLTLDTTAAETTTATTSSYTAGAAAYSKLALAATAETAVACAPVVPTGVVDPVNCTSCPKAAAAYEAAAAAMTAAASGNGGCQGTYASCMAAAAADGKAEAITLADKSSSLSTNWLKYVAATLGGVALAGSLYAAKLGLDMTKGEHNQKAVGMPLALAGGFMAVSAGVFLAHSLKPSLTLADHVTSEGVFKADAAKELGTFSSMPTMMKLAGGAAIITMTTGMMKQPKAYTCKSAEECKKIEDIGASRQAPSESAKGEHLA